MRNPASVDYYEVLQISPLADRELIQTAYRLLARRYHPDNQESGDAAMFRLVTDAYETLGDPDARAQHDALRRDRQFDQRGDGDGDADDANDVLRERACRLTILEALYTKRRLEPQQPTVFPSEITELTGRTPAQLEFAMWFLNAKGLVQRADNSGLSITVAGVEYLEQNQDLNARRRLPEAVGRA
jgi:curved DNA-binding protein CbpA